MSSKSKNTTQTQTQATANTNTAQAVDTKPWNYQDLDQLYASAFDAYGKVAKTPEQVVAGVNPTLQSGYDATLAAAPGLGMGADQLRSLATTFTAPAYLDVQNDPAFQASLRASLNPLTDTLTHQVLPGINGVANAGNAFGGTRQGVAQALAIGDYTRNASDALATATQNEIARRSAQAQGAGTLFTQANNLALSPATAIMGVGNALQSVDQARAAASATAPMNGLQQLMAALSVMGNGQTGTTNTQTQGTQTGSSNSTSTTTDPFGFLKLLMQGAQTGASVAAGG